MTLEQKEEIKILRKEGMAYKDIGIRFGVSRQRIHQIISGYKSPYKKKGGHRFAQGVGHFPHGKHFTLTRSSGFGAKGEEWFIKECEIRGIELKDVRETMSYDFMVNHQRVEVKTSHLSKTNTCPTWNFNLLNNQDSYGYSFDLLVCIGIENTKQHVFIIPACTLADNLSAITIRPKEGTRSYERYKDYKDMWEFLGSDV